MVNECQPCKAKQMNNLGNQNIPIITLANQTNNCSITLSFLNYLINLIDLNISNVNNEDRVNLQIYKGQIQSGISIQNYCYIDYNITETNIFNVLSKY
jgi:hypothetical protein